MVQWFAPNDDTSLVWADPLNLLKQADAETMNLLEMLDVCLVASRVHMGRTGLIAKAQYGRLTKSLIKELMTFELRFNPIRNE